MELIHCDVKQHCIALVRTIVVLLTEGLQYDLVITSDDLSRDVDFDINGFCIIAFKFGKCSTRNLDLPQQLCSVAICD